jgi:branched-chain amino acid transport system permease protein
VVQFFAVLFNGIAYGVVLFLMAGGLSLTMGLMGFANLAHAAFAMFGAYVMVTAINHYGVPFWGALAIAAVVTAIVAVILELAIFRRMYRAPELDQVLLTIGIVFMWAAATTFFWGAAPQVVTVPAILQGQIGVGGFEVGVYRLFLIIVGAILIAALVAGIERTTFGAKIRAAVDNRRMTMSCGVDVDVLFTIAFAIGAALAGLGGALSVNLLGLDPNFGLTYLVYVLIVVVVGGLGSISGSLVAALALGIADVVGKYYVPQAGAFIIYAITVAILLARPQGLFARR